MRWKIKAYDPSTGLYLCEPLRGVPSWCADGPQWVSLRQYEGKAGDAIVGEVMVCADVVPQSINATGVVVETEAMREVSDAG